MQSRKEEISDFDTNLYWNEIEEQEQAGLKFKEILNDVIEFEKGVVLKEFQLANDNGDLLFDGSFKTGFLRAAGFCILCGFVWYLLEGQDISQLSGRLFLAIFVYLHFLFAGITGALYRKKESGTC